MSVIEDKKHSEDPKEATCGMDEKRGHVVKGLFKHFHTANANAFRKFIRARHYLCLSVYEVLNPLESGGGDG